MIDVYSRFALAFNFIIFVGALVWFKLKTRHIIKEMLIGAINNNEIKEYHRNSDRSEWLKSKGAKKNLSRLSSFF